MTMSRQLLLYGPYLMSKASGVRLKPKYNLVCPAFTNGTSADEIARGRCVPS